MKGQLSLGKVGTSDGSGVTISEVTSFSLLQIAAWPDCLQDVGGVAAVLADCDRVPSPGQAVQGTQATLMRVEPLKWWLISQHGHLEQLSLAGDKGAGLDLSSSRTWLTLHGPKAADLLNHFLPLNLSDTAFPLGSVASTAIHHVGVTLWRDAQGISLLLPRSFAVFLWEQLTDSAAQYGYEVA
ncbi:sarcosine oxidase subunit gamma [Roseibium denhamense]|nr:sarcosine oxidase subunit gamma [Roseibium denhamense]